jgi:phosphoribosyl-AMP cyclohydrolase
MIKPDFKKSPLIPTIAQDFETNEVLMLAYMNEEAWNEMLKTGAATYWSRSRNKLWRKGEDSGNIQKVKEIYLDCDDDTVLLKVEQIGGAACHEGYKTCFFKKLNNGKIEISSSRVFDPEKVYKK